MKYHQNKADHLNHMGMDYFKSPYTLTPSNVGLRGKVTVFFFSGGKPLQNAQEILNYLEPK